jgi:predicted metal-dependent peptidase
MTPNEFEKWQEGSMDRADRYSDQLLSVCEKILTVARNSLFVKYRYLENAIGRFDFIPYNGTMTTDGEHIFYDPEWVIKRYEESEKLPAHDLLHQIVHCIYRHAFVMPSINRELWNIAADMATESVLADLDKNIPISIKKRDILEDLKKQTKLLSAERLFQYFEDLPEEDKHLIEEWGELFSDSDDHSAWYENKFKAGKKGQSGLSGKGSPKPQSGDSGDGSGSEDEDKKQGEGGENESDSERRNKLSEKWKDISEHVQKDLEEFSKKQGSGAGSLIQGIKDLNKEKYDYTEFLKKFCTLQEVMKLDMDEFDYNFYAHGLEVYGDVALIEPLEYKDERRLREFVIAIDTSGSVQGELVQNFLTKTYNIMMNNTVGRNLNIWIIQCDADIQEARQITSKSDFEQYIKNMKLKGFGGTDFRPVFEFVNNQIANKVFTDLKGLIYFTDGYGTFPKAKQPYDTAFVFVNERNDPDFEPPEVPPWAIKLVLDGRDI